MEKLWERSMIISNWTRSNSSRAIQWNSELRIERG